MDLQSWLAALDYVNSSGEVLRSWAAAIPLAISGISALSGLFANRKKQAQQEQTSTTNQTTMPQYDDQSLYMRNYLMDQYLENMRHNDDMFQGYTREGLNKINTGSDIAGRALQNILASRGLSGTSAGVASEVSNRMNTANQQASFLNQIPLLADQRRQQNLLAGSQFFSALPKGQTTTSTTKGNTTTTQPSNMLGGMFGGLANSLMGLYGMGAFGGGEGVSDGGLGTGGISPADIYYGQNPYNVPKYPGTPPIVGTNPNPSWGPYPG